MKKQHSLIALAAVLSGCTAETQQGAGFDANQCLSETASLVGFSGTAMEITGNGSVGGTVVLLGNSTLRLTGNAKVSGNVVAPAAGALSRSGNASFGKFIERDLSF